jgi:hypothetical protein
MQYQTKICEAFWDIHGKNTPMALRKTTFVIGTTWPKIEKTARNHANISHYKFRQNSINGLRYRPYIKNYGYVILLTVGFFMEQYD